MEDTVVSYGYEEVPQSAVVEGEWMLVSLHKFWFKFTYQRGNESQEGGLTLEKPFGHEIKLAVPLMEQPMTPVPDGAITLEQMKFAFNQIIKTTKTIKE